MKKVVLGFGLFLVLSAGAHARDGHHECEAALDKLKDATQEQFAENGHHEHQQAKQARDDGDFKKCTDQAEKALGHLKPSKQT